MRRINADFVPVAVSMKAQTLEMGDDAESRLFQSIYRSKVQPQGPVVLSAEGRPLAWALLFDRKRCVFDFLDHSLRLFGKGEPTVAERYLRFPSSRLEDAKVEKPTVAERHAEGERCPAKPSPLPKGTCLARVVGRALDDHGRPFETTVNQEHYAQDQFALTPSMQAALAKAIADAKDGRARVPDGLARLLVKHAYLGAIDMGPLTDMSILRVEGDLKRCEFRVEPSGSGWRVEGASEVLGQGSKGDFILRHEVTLAWRGFVEMKDGRITRLLLLAEGHEKLRWGSEGMKAAALPEDEAALTSVRTVDLACGVRYGIIGEPATDTADGVVSEASIQEKMQRMQEGVHRWQQDGRDLSPVCRIFEKFEPLMKQGKPREAEAVLDEAIKLLEEKK